MRDEKELAEQQKTKLARLLYQERKKGEARASEEMEQMRLKFLAREEKYLLDGDRNELYAIKRELDELKEMNGHLTGTTATLKFRQPAEEPHPYSSKGVSAETTVETNRLSNQTTPSLQHDPADLTHDNQTPGSIPNQARRKASQELYRLENERQSLLRSGGYVEDSYMIQELNRLIYIARETNDRLLAA